MANNGSRKDSYSLFLDFDNTITTFDILDDMMERFSADDKWVELEDRWRAGKIGSRLCLDGQIKGIRIKKKRLDKYLKTIRLDPAFKKLIRFCDSKGIKTVILSDDFDYILKSVLRNNGIRGLEFYCNALKLSGDRLVPSFPFLNKDCRKCAHCKKTNLVANLGKGSIVAYVGDGLSDVCPSKRADVVFAKGSLEKYCKKEKMEHISISGLNDVYKYFQRRIQ